jgi:hypothetical protein
MQGRGRREPRVVEVVARIVGHFQTVHHPAGRLVRRSGVGDDVVQVEAVERIGEHRRRSFGCVSVTPGVSGQPPADVDRWREGGLEAWPREAGVADELTVGLDCPEAEPVSLEPDVDDLDEVDSPIRQSARRRASCREGT